MMMCSEWCIVEGYPVSSKKDWCCAINIGRSIVGQP